MGSISFDDEIYILNTLRYQCLKCDQIVEKLFGSCKCGNLMIQRGQRKGFHTVRDVSVWKSKSGKVLPQFILDRHFNLRGESDESGTHTESGTRAR